MQRCWWWKARRPEIVAAFEQEVVGRVPPQVPEVHWTASNTLTTKTGVFPVIQKDLVGHIDNSICPAIKVDIQMPDDGPPIPAR